MDAKVSSGEMALVERVFNLVNVIEHLGAAISEAEDSLPEGFRVDAEHSLADRVRELAELVQR